MVADKITSELELIDINDYECWEDLQEAICQDNEDIDVDLVGEIVEEWWSRHADEIEDTEEEQE
jgi:hypothetical protein